MIRTDPAPPFHGPGGREGGALLISALIVMTLIAALAVSAARVQGVRAAISSAFSLGYALDDLNQAGLDLAVSGLNATACQPENMPGAAMDGSGRRTFSRRVEEEGAVAVSLCPKEAACFTSDWGVDGKRADWVVLMTATLGAQQKSIKAGLQGGCTLPRIPRSVWDKPFLVSTLSDTVTLGGSWAVDCWNSSTCLQANGQSGGWTIPGHDGNLMVFKAIVDQAPPSGGRLQVALQLTDGAWIVCGDQPGGGGDGFPLTMGQSLTCHHSDGTDITTVCDGSVNPECNLALGAIALELGYFDPTQVAHLTLRMNGQSSLEQTRLSSLFLGNGSPGNYDLFTLSHWQ
ncbi:MAG: hypothetical protein HQL72_13595 [Magnetococcales bacterium]|nr:hypothetical protein [Magnetococcales bacterium]